MSTAHSTGLRRAVSADEAGTVDRILDGTLKAAARRGLKKVSMSDIGDSAGVSRGTLYRYFASKDDVVAALPGHVLLRLEDHLRAAVQARPRPEDRLRVVMEAVTGYAEAAPDTLRLIRLEPDFGLAFLEHTFPDTVRIVTDLLEPVIEDAGVVRARVITGPELAEIMLRIAMSGYLVPGTRTRQLPKRVANFWEFLNTAPAVAGTGEDSGTGRIAGITRFSQERRQRGA